MRKKLLVLGLVLALAISLVACNSEKQDEKDSANNQKNESQDKKDEDSEEKKSVEKEETKEDSKNVPTDDSAKKVVRLSSFGGSDAGLPNPFRHVPRGPGIFKMQLIYDSLLEKGKESDIPWLAKSYKVSEDGKTISFVLNDNIKWHDGIAMSSEDVKFSFDYYAEHPPVRNSLLDKGKPYIESVEITSPKEFNVVLKEYKPAYLSALGQARILPKHVWEKVDDPTKYEGEDATIGSGPYKLEKYLPEQGMYRFTEFKDYYGFKPRFTAIEYVNVSNEVLALENKEIDLGSLSPDTIGEFEGKENYEIRKFNPQHCYRLYVNMEKRPEFTKDVRKAMAYGIDRQGIIDKVERGYGEIAPMGYLYTGHPYYNANIEAYKYDENKAKELMAGKEIEVSLLTSNKPNEIKIAELIKLDLEKLGFKINIKSQERKSRDQAVKKNDYEMALIYYGGLGGDPDMLKMFYSYGGKGGGTVPGYSNKDLDKLLDAQSKEINVEKRKEIVNEIQAMIADDVPMILLHSDIAIVAYDKTVSDAWTGVYDHSRIQHPKLSFVVYED